MSDREFENCTTCGVTISNGTLERHHFPIPEQYGGTETIPLCRSCHDLIDRFGILEWPTGWFFDGFSQLPRQGKLLLMKTVSMFHSARHDRKRNAEVIRERDALRAAIAEHQRTKDDDRLYQVAGLPEAAQAYSMDLSAANLAATEPG